jgi:DNA polymerase-4
MPSTSGNRTIAHFDLDSFFVSVERLKNPSLIGKPIAVGGHSDRGVVASCSYEARKFGVKSAMPAKLARRLCPEIIMVPGDMHSYSHYSRLVTEIISNNVPLFEKSSIDEFYIDMSGMDKFFGSVQYTAELRQKIIKESGLSISYALASNKLVAKVATNEVKPNGEIVIPHGTEKDYLAPLHIEKLPMIGKQTGTTLQTLGLVTVGDLSRMPLASITKLLGKNGISLWNKANGIDDSPVIPYHEQKSISTENTFQSDTNDINFLITQLARMTEQVAFELRENNRLTGCVTVKIRYSDFHTVTKQTVVPYTCADHLLLEHVKQLFDKLYDKKLLVRLIGVRFSQLVPGNYQIQLFDDTNETINLYQAIDHIKHRFGENKLLRVAGASYVSKKYQAENTEPENEIVKQTSVFGSSRAERRME